VHLDERDWPPSYRLFADPSLVRPPSQDVRKFDCPIVYASPTFSNLTGYEGKEIVGKNCRFLQCTFCSFS
jgi:hypothetical protein